MADESPLVRLRKKAAAKQFPSEEEIGVQRSDDDLIDATPAPSEASEPLGPWGNPEDAPGYLGGGEPEPDEDFLARLRGSKAYRPKFDEDLDWYGRHGFTPWRGVSDLAKAPSRFPDQDPAEKGLETSGYEALLRENPVLALTRRRDKLANSLNSHLDRWGPTGPDWFSEYPIVEKYTRDIAEVEAAIEYLRRQKAQGE